MKLFALHLEVCQAVLQGACQVDLQEACQVDRQAMDRRQAHPHLVLRQ